MRTTTDPMNESLKELAVRYFEGPIAPEEECELFGFLAASPETPP